MRLPFALQESWFLSLLPQYSSELVFLSCSSQSCCGSKGWSHSCQILVSGTYTCHFGSFSYFVFSLHWRSVDQLCRPWDWWLGSWLGGKWKISQNCRLATVLFTLQFRVAFCGWIWFRYGNCLMEIWLWELRMIRISKWNVYKNKIKLHKFRNITLDLISNIQSLLNDPEYEIFKLFSPHHQDTQVVQLYIHQSVWKTLTLAWE